MNEDFSLIQQIKSTKEEIERLTSLEHKLSTPVLTDKRLIPEIYNTFKDAVIEMGLSPTESLQKKKFIFIVLFLYSPMTLAGYHIPRGLRNIIAEVSGLRTPKFITNNKDDISFLSVNDKYFRADIEYLYNKIMDRLKVKGLTN